MTGRVQLRYIQVKKSTPMTQTGAFGQRLAQFLHLKDAPPSLTAFTAWHATGGHGNPG